MTDSEIIEYALYASVDPTVNFPTEKGPGDMPALTTLLHRVCNNDAAKFEEATRLVTIFMEKAIELYAVESTK